MIAIETTALSRRRLLGAGLLGAGMMAAPRWALAAPAPSFPAIEKMLTDYVDGGKLAGAVASVGFGQAPPTFLARGRQSLDAPTPIGADSLFRIYSMTKPITGMAAMILVDEGKLRLDQPLSDILPKFKAMQVLKDAGGPLDQVEAAKTPITIRNLLTHTAGLGYHIIQKGPIQQAYMAAGLVPAAATRLPIPGLSGGKVLPSLAAFADALAAMPLVYQPGTKWSYSVGLDLMGRVIEVVSGMPFDRFVMERIVGPCGMGETGFAVAPALKDRLTSNYGVLDGALLPLDPARNSIFLDPPPYPFGGAGLVSSPRDYDRFLQMLVGFGKLGTRRVMSESAVRMGTSNLLPAGVPGPDGSGFGAGGRVGLGESAGVYGWGGAAGTIAFADLKRGIRAGFYTQYMPSDAYPIHAAFPVAVRSDLAAMAGKLAA
ncbi:serine hydrolase domain-containing protein [Parablastomonas sp. CN1-191]|uniref:serine hydrolase domain-containing protein n=1 Tax=Parablastomonas sp. CN1-191 TaxID=3400908 RepID=UPI003BF8D7AC